MKDKYIVNVSLTMEIEASEPSAAALKAVKKFGKYTVNEIHVFNADGSEAMKIHPEAVK